MDVPLFNKTEYEISCPITDLDKGATHFPCPEEWKDAQSC